jgi:carboxypeptidase C (cathepsin A)
MQCQPEENAMCRDIGLKRLFVLAVFSGFLVSRAFAADDAKDKDAAPDFKPTTVESEGSVKVAGKRIDYRAVAGTIVVHAKDWDDVASAGAKEGKHENPTAAASMYYTAYFEKAAAATGRPLTFLFNGGPGSSTVWLHMGAFGPVRVVTRDAAHTPAAPYAVINNDESLLDASDLVFIDAPGTGFSRIGGKDKEKAFYGVDQDIHAFAEFIREFLSKYGRWNSPKYVFGESYGTMRGAGLAYALQQENIDLNGLILLSDILNWDLVPDDPKVNPGIDEPYIVSLPTYAATAWYHDKLGNRAKELRPFLSEVETFAAGDYARALMRGDGLDEQTRTGIAEKLHAYTGLSVAYLLKTDLRIEYGAFQKEILGDSGQTTGTLDTRFVGATLDPLSKIAEYDPQSAAISSAYVAAWNDYVRKTLKFGTDQVFKPEIPIYESWDYKHRPPGAKQPLIALPNVLPDLAAAMKQNPNLNVMVNGGYFDISTPYFAGRFELQHLPVPASLRKNIEYQYYESGHMVYVTPAQLAQLHQNVAGFIRRTDNVK